MLPVCRSNARCVNKTKPCQSQAVQAVEAMDAGKHVMIEKPMALSHQDADDIEAARVRNGVVAFIGYMRRYATAFLRVKELVKEAKEINYGAHDLQMAVIQAPWN